MPTPDDHRSWFYRVVAQRSMKSLAPSDAMPPFTVRLSGTLVFLVYPSNRAICVIARGRRR